MYSTPPRSVLARQVLEEKLGACSQRVLQAQPNPASSVKTEVPAKAPPSATCSKYSESEIIARKKRLELEAAQARARIQTDLIDKQLAADIAELQVDRMSCGSRSRKSAKSSVGDANQKVDEWMQRSHLDAEEQQVPLASGLHFTAPPPPPPPAPAAASSDIQLLAYALKDAFATTAAELAHRPPLQRSTFDKQELPSFYGDPMEWLTFSKAYTDSTLLCKYTDAENLWRLRQCLRGEAKETVSALLISSTSAVAVFEALELRYGRPEVIINKITAQLKKLPSLPPAYHSELVNFSIKVKNYVAAAQAIQKDDYLRSPELMTVVVAKCPTGLLTKWADYAYSHQDTYKAKLVLFSEFLFEEAQKTSFADISNVHVHSLRRPDERKPEVRHTLTAIQTDKATEKKCSFCRGTFHTLPNCPKFKRAMRKDRWRFVRSKHLCHKCLITIHNRDQCPAANCEVNQCGLPHHKLLHWSGPASASTSQQQGSEDVAVFNVTEDCNEPPPPADDVSCDCEVPCNGDSCDDVVPPPPSARETVANTIAVSDSVVMLKIVPVTLHGRKGAITTYALLDDGATVSLIASDIADAIGLEGSKRQLRMRGAWDSNEIVCNAETVSCKISGSYADSLFDFNAQKIAELNLPEQKLLKVNLIKYKHLYNTITKNNLITNTICKPKVLIGQDNYDLMKPMQLLVGNKNEPFGTLTPLGWCVHGLMSTLSPAYLPSRKTTDQQLIGDNAVDTYSYLDSPSQVHLISSLTAATAAAIVEPTASLSMLNTAPTQHIDNCELSELVRKSFSLDALGISAAAPRQNQNDVRAIGILDNTARLSNGRWEVGLPWKSNALMPDSYPQALKRLKSIENKMSKNLGFAERYTERIHHLKNNNYARELDDNESGPRVWYLPHFGVDNPNKKKLRLVFDAAATTEGFCLNSYLLQGPDLLESLLGIMLRFREYRIGISADIRDMFLRVKIKPEDQHALRFLWRSDEDGRIKHYAMTSLIFGANCSPFVAQYIKNRNAERFSKNMSSSVQAILKNHYCDDYVDSFSSSEVAIKAMNEIVYIHKQGGFHICNWTSNDPAVCRSAPDASLSTASVGLNFHEDLFERTLGLLWYPTSDCLGFNVTFKNVSAKILNGERKPTKRELLRMVMSIFDIFGFLTPFTVKAKIILQCTWKHKIGWDQPITDDMFIIFKDWIAQINSINNLRIPRWYFYSRDNIQSAPGAAAAGAVTLELHVFSDASPSSFAAAAYWRSYSNDNKDDISVNFIMSKSRLSPLKPISVPRLELQAAVLACRLANTIIKEHRLLVNETFFWTDSTTVLLWIRNDQRNYNTFVANRLGEIDDLSNVRDWHYVPSELNIADVATKHNTYQLTENCEWFRGPQFLRQPAGFWPPEPVSIQNVYHTRLELLNNENSCVPTAKSSVDLPIPNISRFSSWLKLLRSTSFVLLFIEKCKKKCIHRTIDNKLMLKAEILLLRYSQSVYFSCELSLLRQKKPIGSNSPLRTLSPVLGEDGLLRVQGRIDEAKDISLHVKSPVILHGSDYISRLIVKHYHVKAAHASNEMVINDIRQKYWLVRLRPTVRSVAAGCLICRLRKVRPQPPRLGDLPEGRLAHHQRPFSHCGVDLFGPIDVTVGRRREKRYGVLFTCLTIRAVHIEVVASLSTDSLIMALRRMAARRGWPAKFYSDNGTNLRGADAELKRSFDELSKEYLQEYVTNVGVEWQFISPASPHMGGAWERLIRSVKTALRVVLKERVPHDETLLTLLAEVEGMINNRPLTHVSVEVNANEALTPNHFLLGSSSGLPVPGAFSDSDLYLRKQWRVAQRLADLFWRRWVKEVLPSLLPRQKWTEETSPLQEGDLVFIADPNAPRNSWPRGRVLRTHPGRDGRVRVVDVKTKTGVLQRPVVRVARLPRDDECRRDDTGGRL